jgi:hypothetical protein
MVSSWEAGAAGIRLETVHAIEQSLGLEPGELLVKAGYVVQTSDQIRDGLNRDLAR